jgi:tetratricopeptide (TPR) repeat protein
MAMPIEPEILQEQPPSAAPRLEPAASAWPDLARAVVQLGAVMLLVAACGAIWVLKSYRQDLRFALELGGHAWRRWFDLFPGVEKIDLLRAFWPVGVALALFLTRWPRLAAAAAITFLALAVDRIAGYAVAVSALLGPPGMATPRTLASITDLATSVGLVLGAALAGINALVGLHAWRVDRSYRRLASKSLALAELLPPADRRRALAARLVTQGSVLFAVALCGARLWDFYVDVLSFLPSVRKAVLTADIEDRARGAPGSVLAPVRPEDKETYEIVVALQQAIDLHQRQYYREARRLHRRLLESLDRLTHRKDANIYQRNQIANLANSFAWYMAITADEAGLDPTRSVELAQRAVELAPRDGNIWNTLAVGYYRAGDFAQAERAFQTSMELREGGDAFDWYFLTMMRARAGKAAEARRLFDQAVAWSEGPARGIVTTEQVIELHRFRREAADALGIDDPASREPLPARTRGAPRKRGPGRLRVEPV